MKGFQTNKGTIIRTILAIATVINSGAIATGIAEFQNPQVDMIYKILSFAATAVILFVNTYFNNDFTTAACIGTETTHMLKDDKDGWDIDAIINGPKEYEDEQESV